MFLEQSSQFHEMLSSRRMRLTRDLKPMVPLRLGVATLFEVRAHFVHRTRVLLATDKGAAEWRTWFLKCLAEALIMEFTGRLGGHDVAALLLDRHRGYQQEAEWHCCQTYWDRVRVWHVRLFAYLWHLKHHSLAMTAKTGDLLCPMMPWQFNQHTAAFERLEACENATMPGYLDGLKRLTEDRWNRRRLPLGL